MTSLPFIQELITSIGAFILGGIFGFFVRPIFDKKNLANKFTPETFILMTVTLIWAFSTLYDIFSPIYETPALVHGMMGVIVGFFFKPWTIKNDTQGAKENK